MYRQTRLFTGYAASTARPPAPPALDLTPSQQLALLILRRSDASRAVVKALMRSTVRAGYADFRELVTQGLAIPKANASGHELTPRGRFHANALACQLATQFNVSLPQPARIEPRRRGAFTRGVMSQAGNW